MTKIKILENKIYKFVKKHLKGYEFVYITADLRGFIKKYGIENPEQICQIFVRVLLKLNLTIIVPTYSYTDKGKFNVEDKNSNLGFLTKWILKQKNIKRSEHPLFSVAALGKKSSITQNIGRSAFGKESIFDRLIKKKTSLFHFGRPFSFGNTIIHYVEQNVNVSYRINKIFKTRVYKKDRYVGKNYSTFVRIGNKKNKKYISNTFKIDIIIKKNHLLKQIGDEKKLTNISHLDMFKTFNFMKNQYHKDKKIFIN